MFTIALLSLALSHLPATEPEIYLPGIVSTGFDDAHVSFAPDGNRYFFIRNTPDFRHWTVLMREREGTGWGPVEVAPFSGRWSDADVFVTRDGKQLFFISNRPVKGEVAREDSDIWTIDLSRNDFGEPRHVAELSSEGFEWFPTLTDSGTIYFGSERKGGLGQTDLWRAHWLGDRFSEPENLGPEINSALQEIEPLIARDESWLIFAAKGRPDSVGDYDLYVSYNCSGGWTTPVPLPGPINSPGWDFGPQLSPDAKKFYFTSNRTKEIPTGQRLNLGQYEKMLSSPGNGLRDVYEIDASKLSIGRTCPAPK
ncbi:MAG: PD40 domain-containing protein [Sphingosinicella sp.]|nr:PD40 domain-containing protein [Sphingosinicella sp.]